MLHNPESYILHYLNAKKQNRSKKPNVYKHSNVYINGV